MGTIQQEETVTSIGETMRISGSVAIPKELSSPTIYLDKERALFLNLAAYYIGTSIGFFSYIVLTTL
jgi:hypothetical protein